MKYLIILSLLFVTACSGVSLQSVSAPDVSVQELSYKDIVSCKKVGDTEFSDCTVKMGDSGFTGVLRIKTSNIPVEPVEEKDADNAG